MRMPKLLLFLFLAACGPGDSDDTSNTDGGNGDGSQDTALVCDPALKTGCGPNTACYSDFYLTGDLTYACAPPGAGMQGTNCTADTDCASGYWCLKYTDPSNVMHQICSEYCRTTQPGSNHGCSGPQICVETMDAPFGYCI